MCQFSLTLIIQNIAINIKPIIKCEQIYYQSVGSIVSSIQASRQQQVFYGLMQVDKWLDNLQLQLFYLKQNFKLILSVIIQSQIIKIPKQLTMGISESRNAKKLKFDKQQWRFLRQQDKIKIYVDVYSGIETEEHQVIVDGSNNLDEDFQVFNYRRGQDNALVQVYAVEHVYQESSVCGYQGKLRIFLERIPIRFRDLPALKEREIIYILCESIRGFSTCYRNVGLFRITSKMIGINQKGQTKVWLNNNFALNLPSDQKINLQTTSTLNLKMNTYRHELDMLQALLKIIEQKSENGRYPSEFHRIMYQASGFQEAYEQIQHYCRERGIVVPDRIMCENVALPNDNLSQNDNNRNIQNRQHNNRLIRNTTLIDNTSQHSSNIVVHNNHLPQVQNRPEIPSYSSHQPITILPLSNENIRSEYQYLPNHHHQQPLGKLQTISYYHQDNPSSAAYQSYKPFQMPTSSINNNISYTSFNQPPKPTYPSYQPFQPYQPPEYAIPKQSYRETIFDNMHKDHHYNYDYPVKDNYESAIKINYDNPSMKVNYDNPSRFKANESSQFQYLESAPQFTQEYAHNQQNLNSRNTALYNNEHTSFSIPRMASLQDFNYQPINNQSKSFLPSTHISKGNYQATTPDYHTFNASTPYF